jgi:hypothetical protein
MQVVTRVLRENKFEAPSPETNQSYVVARINEMTNEQLLRIISEEVDELLLNIKRRDR